MNFTTRATSFRRLNTADWISMYRIMASGLLLLLLLLEMKMLFACFLAISLASDIIDGMVARKLNICTARGARLDSIGDALTFVLAATGIWYFEKDFLRANKTWLLLAVVPYVVQILLAVARYGRPSSFHTYLAKAAALLQGTFILLLFFLGPIPWLFYAAVGITVLEVLEEMILLFLLRREDINVKGLYWVLKGRRKKQ
ncbi:MAG: CDP-diacylglycerol--glycerol-3-phosphate 3-phosphatidyltransferase [Bacteroidetes bacterium]|nr:MAG: CDP-diacylglycerol--glycerol-3-phosphate 3-phosphatidyltransferase [Bacteroidota bacterium]